MVLNLKNSKNKILKISFTFLISALSLVLGLSVRSNAKADIYVPNNPPGWTYEPFYDNVFENYRVSCSVRGFGGGTNNLNGTLRYSSFTPSVQLLNIGTMGNLQTNFAQYPGTTFFQNVSKIENFFVKRNFTIFGNYFNSLYFFNSYYDYDSFSSGYVANLYNHIRFVWSPGASSTNAIPWTDVNYLYVDGDVTSSFDGNLYLLVMIDDSSLYTSIYNNTYQYIYDLYSFNVDSSSVINTGLQVFNAVAYDSDTDRTRICLNTNYMGFVTDIYFDSPLKYSVNNNLVGVFFNFCPRSSDSNRKNVNYYMYTYLDYSPYTANDYSSGYVDGVNSVDTQKYFDEGRDKGYIEGQNSINVEAIRQNAYTEGRNDGLAVSSADYGIKDLLYSIFDIPINVLSNLFSFTIFGTNVWTIIVSLLVVLAVLWVVSRVMGLFFAGGGKR